jgi:hypothetical protein
VPGSDKASDKQLRLPLGSPRDEIVNERRGEDAPVGVSRPTVEGIDLISRTAVYVTRMYGGVGGAEP